MDLIKEEKQAGDSGQVAPLIGGVACLALGGASVQAFQPVAVGGVVRRPVCVVGRASCSTRRSSAALPLSSSDSPSMPMSIDKDLVDDGSVPLENLQRARTIREAIRGEDKRLRSRVPLLADKYQDAVGTTIFLGAVASWFMLSLRFAKGLMGGPQVIALNALVISFLHELEHDLIHELYWKRLPLIQHLMFAVIWVLKGSASPWWRKKMHLKHHQESGQVTDAEERLIGLGLRWNSLRRALITLTPFGTLAVAWDINRDEPKFSVKEMFFTNVGMVTLGSVSMVIHALAHFRLLGVISSWLPALTPVVALVNKILPFAVLFNFTINFPNLLRQASLVTVSTWSHYFGDIPKKDLMFQTQILDHWLLAPMQLFCFNFGQTHILHHFFTQQPFYLRQLSAFKALPVLKEQGCRHNDLGNMFRANRWGPGLRTFLSNNRGGGAAEQKKNQTEH